MKRSYFRSLLLVCVFVLSWTTAAPTARAEPCGEGHALIGVNPASSGAEAPGRISDGWLVPEGRGYPSAGAGVLAARSVVLWQLRETTRIRSLLLQADANDTAVVETSMDGRQFTPLWSVPAVEGTGFRTRAALDVDALARFVRLRAATTDGVFAVTELVVGCRREDAIIRSRFVREEPILDAESTRRGTVGAGKLLFAALALAGLALVRRRGNPPRLRRLACGAIIGLSLFAWLDFGTYARGSRGPLHLWDSAHYFLGSKYVETGYFDLYRCVAHVARDAGRSEFIDGMRMRRLEDNVGVPGTWTHTRDGQCDVLDAARLASLRRDYDALDGIRWPFGMHPEGIIADRGYLATPFGTAWLRVLTSHAVPTKGYLVGLALLDLMFVVLVVAVMGWGFGLEAAAMTAIAIGVGEPWDYYWLGGALDRWTWLFALAGGLAALKRERFAMAGVALAVATALRVFPGFVVVGVLAALALSRHGESRARLRRFALGLVVTGALAGLVGGAVAGPTAYGDFLRRARIHAGTPVANELGGRAALRFTAADTTGWADGLQLDPVVPWQTRVRAMDHERTPLRVLLGLAAFAVFARSLARRASPGAVGFASLAMLVCVFDIATYYAVFVALLPSVARSGRALLAAPLVAMISQALYLLRMDSLVQYALLSLVVLGGIAWVVLHAPTTDDDAAGGTEGDGKLLPARPDAAVSSA